MFNLIQDSRFSKTKFDDHDKGLVTLWSLEAVDTEQLNRTTVIIQCSRKVETALLSENANQEKDKSKEDDTTTGSVKHLILPTVILRLRVTN